MFAARELLDATGRCRVLLNTTFCRARVQRDAVTAVEAWFSGKRLVVEADVFIDSTADGDLAADAGCEYHLGEDSRWNQLAGKAGYGTWAISGIAPRIGVRETRRLLGDYVLTEVDCQAGLVGQKHEDVIAISDHAVIHGKTYYYLRECQRVNGRPKIVKTVYLGTPQKILAAIEGVPSAPQHESVDIAAFGDVLALYDGASFKEQNGTPLYIQRREIASRTHADSGKISESGFVHSPRVRERR